MAHTWRARDRASRAPNLDLSKLSQDFRFYFDSIFAESFTTIFLSTAGIKVTKLISFTALSVCFTKKR